MLNKIKNLVIYILLGIIGGILGSSFVFLYIFNPSKSELNYSKLDNLTEGFKELINKYPQKVVIEQDQKYNRIADETKSSLVEIYKRSIVNEKISGKNAFYFKEVIYPDQFICNGVILTTDGWIMAFNPIFDTLTKENYIDYIIVTHNKNIFKPVTILKDSFTGLNFFKVEGSGLSVLQLAEANEITQGQTLIVNGKDDKIRIENINKVRYSSPITRVDYIKSSEKLNSWAFIENKLSADYSSAAVIGLNGRLIGIMNSENTMILAGNIENTLKNFLKHKNILRPSLGIKYVELSSLIGNINYEKRGVLVYDIIQGSSSSEAGLKKDDIILKIENEEVKENNLPELIQDYEKDVFLNFLIIRNNKELNKQVILK